MRKIEHMLSDVKFMKLNAKLTAQIITKDIKCFGTIRKERMQTAARSRYQLDKILLDTQSIINKWAQYYVYDYNIYTIVLRGNKKECEEFVDKHKTNSILATYYILPDNEYYDWNKYFDKLKERCNIVIE